MKRGEAGGGVEHFKSEGRVVEMSLLPKEKSALFFHEAMAGWGDGGGGGGFGGTGRKGDGGTQRVRLKAEEEEEEGCR